MISIYVAVLDLKDFRPSRWKSKILINLLQPTRYKLVYELNTGSEELIQPALAIAKYEIVELLWLHVVERLRRRSREQKVPSSILRLGINVEVTS